MWELGRLESEGLGLEAQSLRTPQVMSLVWRKLKGSQGARREWQEEPEAPQQAWWKRSREGPGQGLSRDSGLRASRTCDLESEEGLCCGDLHLPAESLPSLCHLRTLSPEIYWAFLFQRTSGFMPKGSPPPPRKG